MQAYLRERGLWQAVADPDQLTEDQKHDDCDGKALAAIILHIRPQLQYLLQPDDTAKAAWDRIRASFGGKSKAQQTTIRRRLAAVKKLPTESVSDYFGRVLLLRDELVLSGAEMKDSDLMPYLLAGLPAEFDTTVDLLEDVSDVAPALSRLQITEDRLRNRRNTAPPTKHSRDTREAKALAAMAKKKQQNKSLPTTPGAKCDYCGRLNHTEQQCHRKQQDLKRQKASSSGGKTGSVHQSYAFMTAAVPVLSAADLLVPDSSSPVASTKTLDKCSEILNSMSRHSSDDSEMVDPPAIPDILPSARLYQAAAMQCANPPAAMTIESEANFDAYCLRTVSGGSPILDSGASHHMTADKTVLHNFRTSYKAGVPTMVETANGARVPVQGVGDMHLSCIVKGQVNSVTLKDVLLVPSIQQTLISLASLTSRGASVSFVNDRCIVSYSDKPVMFATRSSSQKHGLYVISTCMAVARAQFAKAHETPYLWHRRLGHLSFTGLAALTKMSQGMHITDKEFRTANVDGVCYDCMLGGQTRLPRAASQYPKATKPLHRLHSDMCGPFTPQSPGGCKYFLLVLDECTRYSVLHFLAHKHQAAQRVQDTIEELENRTGQRVKFFRSDRGGEFTSDKLDRYFARKGIKAERTAAYSPESNGMAERCNRTLVTRARAMLSYAKLPPTYWAEAVNTANELRNISPASTLSSTPLEALTGKVPDISWLRAFGSLCFVHMPVQLCT